MTHYKKSIIAKVKEKGMFSICLTSLTSDAINSFVTILFPKTSVREKHYWAPVVKVINAPSGFQNRQR